MHPCGFSQHYYTIDRFKLRHSAYVIAHAWGMAGKSSTQLHPCQLQLVNCSVAFEKYDRSLSIIKTAKARYHIKVAWHSPGKWPIHIWICQLSGQYNRMASSQVWSHPLVFHTTARSLHSRTATVLETVEFLCGTSKTAALVRCWKHPSIPASMLQLTQNLCG